MLTFNGFNVYRYIHEYIIYLQIDIFLGMIPKISSLNLAMPSDLITLGVPIRVRKEPDGEEDAEEVYNGERHGRPIREDQNVQFPAGQDHGPSSG